MAAGREIDVKCEIDFRKIFGMLMKLVKYIDGNEVINKSSSQLQPAVLSYKDAN